MRPCLLFDSGRSGRWSSLGFVVERLRDRQALQRDRDSSRAKRPRKAWGEVNLKALLRRRAPVNQAKLLAEEIESTGRLAAVNRETEIRVLARARRSATCRATMTRRYARWCSGGSGGLDSATLGTVESRTLGGVESAATRSGGRSGTSSAPRPLPAVHGGAAVRAATSSAQSDPKAVSTAGRRPAPLLPGKRTTGSRTPSGSAGKPIRREGEHVARRLKFDSLGER